MVHCYGHPRELISAGIAEERLSWIKKQGWQTGYIEKQSYIGNHTR